APAIQAPAAKRCGWVDLDHRARSGTIHWAACGIKLRQQDRAAQGDVCDPVRRDAQRHEAQLVLDERIRATHDEFPAPASSSAVLGNADMADLVGSHETDECARPAERAVNPRLAGLLDGLEDDIVTGRIDNVPDDRLAAVHSILASAVRSGLA